MKNVTKGVRTQEEKERLRKKRARVIRENFSLFTLSFPGMALLFIFSYLPIFGILIAFKDYVPRKGILGSEWVGFDNFRFFFMSQDAVRTIRNTLLYSLDFIFVGNLCGVLMALLLFHLTSSKTLKVYHTIIMLPRFLSIIIVSFITYAFLSPSYGFLNQIISAFGGTPIMWYSEPKYWPFILTIVNLWMSIGTGCLYYYAALVGADPALFEAASIDGANVFQRCWHIAIPTLIPIMTIMLILNLGGIMSSDTGLFYNIPRDSGILYPTTDVLGTYVYRALLGGSMEKSTAVGLMSSVVGLIMVLISNAVVRKISPENSMF